MRWREITEHFMQAVQLFGSNVHFHVKRKYAPKV
jgi:hypothetical protein